jgi:hypothetical protein
MMTITRRLLFSVVLVGAAVGLAGPASAQLEPGSYTVATVGGQFSGVKGSWVVTSCGQNCLTVLYPDGKKTVDFHLEGNTWTGNDPECVRTIDNNSLTVRADCGSGLFESQLTKNG